MGVFKPSIKAVSKKTKPKTSSPMPPSPTSQTAYNTAGFAESIFIDLDDTERAPGGSLFGCDITNPQPGHTTQFQELGDGVSMVTKTTVVSSCKRTDEDSDYLVSKVHISAGDSYSRKLSNKSSIADVQPS